MRWLVCLPVLLACGPKHEPGPDTPSLQQRPPPTTTSTDAGAQPAQPAVMTKEECEARGGRFNPSIGGGDQPHCADGEQELGPVRFGIEGGWCCQPKG